MVRNYFQIAFVGCVGICLGLFAGTIVFADNPTPAGPKPLRGLEGRWVQARVYQDSGASGAIKNIGIEVLVDEEHGNLVYVSDSGSIAVVPVK